MPRSPSWKAPSTCSGRPGPRPAPGRGRCRQEQHPAAAADSAERSLLRAAFQDTPVPLFLLTRDGTVQRVNKAAGDLIGAKPGYATGRPFTAFVNLPSRAAVNSQLTAVAGPASRAASGAACWPPDGLVPVRADHRHGRRSAARPIP